MSLMLGPIHYRMFEKACAVDAFARSLAAYSDAQGWTEDLAASAAAETAPLQGTLEDHVDTAQIHASLNALVGRSESALAYVCDRLAGHEREAEQFARTQGEEAGASAQLSEASLQQAWDAIDRHWLDGMPCDGFMRFTDNTPETVAWDIDLGVHTAHGYAGIREAWTRGFAQGAGLALEAANGSYRLQRAA